MSRKMKAKFDKYWGNIDKMNMILFMACILDPRYKMSYVQISLERMYGDAMGAMMATEAKYALNELYLEYKKIFGAPAPASSSSSVSMSSTRKTATNDFEPTSDVEELRLSIRESRMKAHLMVSKVGSNDSSELEKYINEECATNSPNFVILDWWKDRIKVFPVLSKLASDVLAMPISTVSSESAFSTGGRVIYDFRASLSTRMAQALICGQDWMRQDRNRPITYSTEEDASEIERDVELVFLEGSCVSGSDQTTLIQVLLRCGRDLQLLFSFCR